ncbi:SGNH hydrolase-type esterase domain-containing protein [Artemisia annua]|uniref:SGNH hydrolase-type esterase domain-containing protein n=1 Tax=Artemisia annua TaxID=35608 RepID=A0A2U1M7M4_ARTAN|nr:SGNH hydrolase-type esterase domain-containing protein [Artemisia annua]
MASLFSLSSLVILPSILVAFVNGPLGAEARAFFVFGDSLVDNGNNDFLVTSARADSPPYGIDYPTHRPTGRFSNGLNIPDLLSCVFLINNLYSIIVYLTFFQVKIAMRRCNQYDHIILHISNVINLFELFNFSSCKGEHMGMESPLPYLSPLLRGNKLLAGANFASAGIGILNDTGVQFQYTARQLDKHKIRNILPESTSIPKQLNIIRIWQQIEYFQQYQTRLADLIGPNQARQMAFNGVW